MDAEQKPAIQPGNKYEIDRKIDKESYVKYNC